MNYKTTVVLILLAGAVVGCGYYLMNLQPEPKASASADFLTEQLKESALTRVEVSKGKNGFVLQRSSPTEEWSLPGNWPVRANEAAELIQMIVNLRTRFTAFPLADKKDVLAKDPMTLKLKVDGKDHTLVLAEEVDDANRLA